MGVTEEAVCAHHGGGGPCRSWRRTRGTQGAGEEEAETGGAPCCGPVVFYSTMPNDMCMLLGNFTPVYIPIAVVRTGHPSLPAPNQPART